MELLLATKKLTKFIFTYSIDWQGKYLRNKKRGDGLYST